SDRAAGRRAATAYRSGGLSVQTCVPSRRATTGFPSPLRGGLGVGVEIVTSCAPEYPHPALRATLPARGEGWKWRMVHRVSHLAPALQHLEHADLYPVGKARGRGDENAFVEPRVRSLRRLEYGGRAKVNQRGIDRFAA